MYTKQHFSPLLLLLGSVVVFFLSACGGELATSSRPTPVAGRETPDVGASDDTDAQLAEAVAQLYEIQGHLITSQELRGRQQLPVASAHAAHPQSELFSLVKDDLAAAQPGSDTRLLERLQPLPEIVGDPGASTDEVRSAYEAAFAAIEEAAVVLAGEKLQEPAFLASVIIALLESTRREYRESIDNGTVVNLEEYQDAYGYLVVARRLFQHIADDVREDDVGEYFNVTEAFDRLGSLLPATASPPTPPADPALVSTEIKTIQAELAEIFGIGQRQQTPAEILAFTYDQLERAVAAYEAGNTDEAYELASAAYLDGFERLEKYLEAANYTDLVGALEVQFQQLRDKIEDGAPVDELRALQRDIEADLEKVAEALRLK